MSVKGLEMVWTGSVGLDRTLDLKLDIVVNEKSARAHSVPRQTRRVDDRFSGSRDDRAARRRRRVGVGRFGEAGPRSAIGGNLGGALGGILGGGIRSRPPPRRPNLRTRPIRRAVPEPSRRLRHSVPRAEAPHDTASVGTSRSPADLATRSGFEAGARLAADASEEASALQRGNGD
jgi:hypothetical protein